MAGLQEAFGRPFRRGFGVLRRGFGEGLREGSARLWLGCSKEGFSSVLPTHQQRFGKVSLFNYVFDRIFVTEAHFLNKLSQYIAPFFVDRIDRSIVRSIN